IYNSFLPQTHAKNLELICETDDKLNNNFQGDALRIRQIITNIISNAVKYTPQGNIKVKAKFLEEEGILKIEVKDSGVGMTYEEQKTIFKEFSRLPSTAHIEGTGLGLTITQKLIDLLDGKMYIDSIKGEGSCFTISIPIERSKEIACTVLEEENKTESEETKTLKILLVDDDNIQLEMTSALLHKFGHMVETTTQPSTVTTKIENHDFDLVITDIQMPELSGFDLIKAIRNSSIQKINSICVMAVSGREDIPEVDYLKAGFNGFLNKPFTPAQLNNSINRIVGINSIAKQESIDNNISEISSEKPYTFNNIRSFTDGDEKVLQKIIETFLEETQQNLSLLEKYRKNKQYVLIQQISHRMLPMFRHIEAQKMVDLLSILEKTEIVEEKHPLIHKTTKETINEGKKILQLIREDIGII
ncbi:MAG: response regulator, partial [Odoribacter sp.]|nr:response regulator [Odoribacter sp.]